MKGEEATDSTRCRIAIKKEKVGWGVRWVHRHRDGSGARRGLCKLTDYIDDVRDELSVIWMGLIFLFSPAVSFAWPTLTASLHIV
jgi:hypothetical protein